MTEFNKQSSIEDLNLRLKGRNAVTTSDLSLIMSEKPNFMLDK